MTKRAIIVSCVLYFLIGLPVAEIWKREWSSHCKETPSYAKTLGAHVLWPIPLIAVAVDVICLSTREQQP